MKGEALPEGWEQTTLGAVADFVNGDRGENYPSQADRVGAGVPFINTGHIDANGWLNGSHMDYITRDSFDRLRGGKVKPGDILYCLRGSTIGKTARNHYSEGAIASSLVIVRAKPSSCQEYLYFYLTSPLGKQLVAQHDNGSAQPNLSVRVLSNYPLPLPPLAEQRAIAQVLGTLDDKIELNRRTSWTLEAMARALFQSWFVDFELVRAKAEGRESGLSRAIAESFPDRFEEMVFGRTPKGWRASKLGSEVATVLGGTPSRSDPVFWGGDIPWINSGKTNEFRVIEPSEYITREGLESSATKVLPSRTTIIAITGATLGQVSLTEIETCANQSVVGVLGTPALPSEFLYFWIKEHVDELLAWQTGGAQQHINKNNVNDLPVLCPPPGMINAYVAVVRPLFDRIKVCCMETRSLTAIRDTLLPRLVNGELRVPAELARRSTGVSR